MSEKKFQNRYRIPSARAAWHNYDDGAYFVTICTQGRENHFGEITSESDDNTLFPNRNGVSQQSTEAVETLRATSLQDGERTPKMVLSPIGKYTDEQFRNVRDHYPYAEIPLWVVMPNHVHAVVVIHNMFNDIVTIPGDCRDVARNVSTMCNASTECIITTETITKNLYMSEKSPKRNTLPVVIRGIKSSVTNFANQNHIPFAWQPRYYDRIIRNTEEMNVISSYIEHNVENWETDRLLGV